MKKVAESHSESLPSAKLYLDDIQHIVEILRQASEDVSIQAEGYDLDNWDELIKLKKECIRNLCIKSSLPYITLEISPSRIDLYISNDTAVSRGVFEQIKTVILLRRRPFAWLLHGYLFSNLILILFSFFIIVGPRRWMPATVTQFVACLVFLILISTVWFGFGYYDKFYCFSAVIPMCRVNSPGFFKRNQDKILLILISALIGAAITYIAK